MNVLTVPEGSIAQAHRNTSSPPPTPLNASSTKTRRRWARSIDSRTPVVIAGGTLNSLGVVRSLAPARMPIYVLAESRACAAGWSRHCTLVRVPDWEGPGIIGALIGLRDRFRDRPVLILTSDPCVEAVSAHRERIEPLYRFSLPPPDIVRTLADKTSFQRFAEREGFPVPRGLVVSDESDLAQLEELRYPVVVKPADKALVLRGLVDRAVRAETAAEARSAAERMLLNARSLIVQEWIEGPDSEIYFTLFSCDRRGELLGLFSGRKITSSPPQTGSTAICVAAPEAAAELAPETIRFIAAARYRGLGGLEFKRDVRTGRLAIIEPTVGRTDWQEEIATLCGTNLPLLTYRAELDEATPPPRAAPAPRIGWRAALEHRTSLSMIGRDTRLIDGYFRWSDPLPAIYYYLYERGGVRLWRRVRAGLSHRPAQLSGG